MIYVCILTHNRQEAAKACIESIIPAIVAKHAQLHVLDNGSTDGITLWLSVMANRLNFMQVWASKQNTYAIGGRLRQVDRLLGMGLGWMDTVVFLDSDVTVVKPYEVDWLEKLIAPLQDPRIGISGVYGRNINADWTGFEMPNTLPGRVDVVGGGMTAIRGAVFLSGVEFDQGYLPFWHCDSDLCLQARSEGFEVHCVGEIGLHHDAHHKDMSEQYHKNMRRLKEKWQGKRVLTTHQQTPAARAALGAV